MVVHETFFSALIRIGSDDGTKHFHFSVPHLLGRDRVLRIAQGNTFGGHFSNKRSGRMAGWSGKFFFHSLDLVTFLLRSSCDSPDP